MAVIDTALHVVSSLEVGGAERFVLDLAAAQQGAGLDVAIVSLGVGDEPLVGPAREVARVSVVGGLSAPARLVALARSLSARPRAAVHVHNPWALRQLLPLLPTLRGTVVYTRHGAHPYDTGAWRWVHRLARPFVDRCTFVSADACRVFTAAHGQWSRPHLVVENGVPPAAATAPPHPGALRLGAVGRLVELKGHRVVLEALATMREETRAAFELHVFGDGPLRAELEQTVQTALGGRGVHFHGTVLDRDRVYRDLDVLVVSSRTEGLSMAIMEAMVRGIPVVATDVGGNGRLVHEGETGLLVPWGDASALRDALERLLAEPERVTVLGERARRHVEQSFSIASTARAYQAVYERR